MITENLIKKEFLHDTLVKGVNKIYETQNQIVSKYLSNRSGRLSSFIQRRPFTYSDEENRTVLYMRILPYLRFLDIKSRKGNDRVSRHLRRNLALYNRTVWGVLYHETFPEMQYGFTEEIREGIRRELTQALQQDQTQK